jgi:hypothetical protein
MAIFDRLLYKFKPWLNPNWEKRAAGVTKLRDADALVAMALNDSNQVVREAAFLQLDAPEALVRVILGASLSGQKICSVLNKLERQEHLERLARSDLPNTAREAIADKILKGYNSGEMSDPLGNETMKFILENGSPFLCEKLIDESCSREVLIVFLTRDFRRAPDPRNQIKTLQLKALSKIHSQDDLFQVAQKGTLVLDEVLERLDNMYAERLALSAASVTARVWGIERITDEELLAKIAVQHAGVFEEAFSSAVKRIRNNKFLADIIRTPFKFKLKEDSVKSEIAGMLHDTCLATELAKEIFSTFKFNQSNDTFLRLLEKVEDQAFLGEVGKFSRVDQICSIVIDRINDRNVLFDVIDGTTKADFCRCLARKTHDASILKKILDRLDRSPFPSISGSIESIGVNTTSFLRADVEKKLRKLTEQGMS